MSVYLDELRSKRHKLATDAKAILDKAREEKRALTQEEKGKFDAMMADSDSIENTILAEERSAATQAGLAKPQAEPVKNDPAQRSAGDKDLSKEFRDAFNKCLREGRNALTEPEVRALMQSSDIKGGYLTPPQQFIANLIKAVDDLTFMRQISNVLPLTNSESIGVPTLDTDLNDADWTAELKTVTEDDSIRIGKRELKPHPLTKLVKISRKLLRSSAISPEQLVQERLAYKFASTQEKGFLTGNGAGKPLGVFVASSDGISTSRDQETGTTADIDADSLIEAKYKLKAQYWAAANWIFHRDTLKRIRKLKNAVSGDYIWSPGLTKDQQDTILEVPFRVSEFAPSTYATGAYVAILGDFKRGYWIADALAMELQILVEQYAANNQNGYIARAETDGMPVLEEAFVRLKLK